MNRQATGKTSYLAGASAEAQVAADYERRGWCLAEKRWRGQGGEIDLIFRQPDGQSDEVVFVEVKKARSFSKAASRISMRQQQRICASAEEYLGSQPNGLLTPMRVDAAFVNERGEVQVLENAIGQF